MSLVPGARLGPYEITAQIGVGGMGEVYRATDTNLKRQVAIKVLPAALAADADRLARFQREAEVLASLNHPYIAHIYGLERLPAAPLQDVGAIALVMELVEGPTLADRIAQGAIPLDEALPIAKQIAEALEAAHEQGIIHRDLKPANIKLRADGTVKVLDFGLAKAMDTGPGGSGAGPGGSLSPTITTPAMTQAGMILGTAAYMAPEQARGRTVDRRADIWAFGVVLFEMLTGQRAFKGDDVSITLASVLMQEPDATAVPPETPAALRRLLTRCLKKDPKARLRDIGEARIVIEEIIAGVAHEDTRVQAAAPQIPVQRKASWLPWAVAGVAAIVAAVAARAPWRAGAPTPDLVRLEIRAPEKTTFDNALLLSPDGRHVAFTSSPSSEGGTQIWVRSLDTLQARRVAPWSQNPVPFWSADNRFIVFQQDGKLKKADIMGGPPTTLCDAPLNFAGGAWSRDNVIVFGDRAGGLMQVSSAGGVPTRLTALDEKRQEISHALPSFLPDGKHFVYLRRSSSTEFEGIYVGAVGIAPDQQDSKRLFAADTAAVYTPAPDPRQARELGFLLFVREGTLMAQPFDAARLALKGEPVPVGEKVGTTVYGLGRFTASQNGSLAYLASGVEGTPTQLTWFDRQGKNLGVIGRTGRYDTLALSPDGSRVAAEKIEGKASDLWLIDSALAGKSDRFTFDPGVETSPVWSPDGTQITFAAGASLATAFSFFRKPSNLMGDEVELFKSNQRKVLTDWSGKTLLFTAVGVVGPDLWSMALGSSDKDASGKVGGAKPEAFLKTDAVEMRGKLSPDGRWIAYVSRATGRPEVYVRPFPVSADRTGQQMVSNGGGELPLWRRDGKELFYVAPSPSAVMSVDVETGAGFKSGQPRKLFDLQILPANLVGGLGYVWDVTADGSRFLINLRNVDNETQVPITVVLNWTTGLRK